jgi:hypothetical protein
MLPGFVRAERLVAKRFMCPLKIVQNYVFFPEALAGEPINTGARSKRS